MALLRLEKIQQQPEYVIMPGVDCATVENNSGAEFPAAGRLSNGRDLLHGRTVGFWRLAE